MKRKYVKYLIMGIIAALVATYITQKDDTPPVKGHPRTYEEIIKSGVLRAVTEYNSLSYFVDGDTISGFHYDLIQAFAKSKGLKVEIFPKMGFEERLQGLEEGEYDVIAYGIPVTSELKDSILLTEPILLNKQILIQRKISEKDSSLFIRNQLDLAHKILNVVKGSPAILRIHNLGNEIGDTIFVNEIDKYGPEQLIAMVAHSDINYAVCDESIAVAAIDSFPQLDINTDISFNQFYSWGVSKKSPILLDSLNSWLKTFKGEKQYEILYRKYYKD